MITFDATLNKIAGQVRRIASDDPSLRIIADGNRAAADLVQAINTLADQYEACAGISHHAPGPAANDAADETNILPLISQLPTGVVICNSDGQIIMISQRGIDLLTIHFQQDLGHKTEPGSSVCALIGKTHIEHALDEINEKLKRRMENVMSVFNSEGKDGHVLQIRGIPILNRIRRFSGFFLIIEDITEQVNINNRIDALLQSLTQSARSPLASIRSAIEIILEYPDADKARLRQFNDIIYKESVSLSNILDKAAGEYSGLIQSRRLLVPTSAAYLLETVARRAAQRLGVIIRVEAASDEKIRIKADSFSFVFAFLFILDRLKTDTGSQQYVIRLTRDNRFVQTDLIWNGKPVGPEALKKWSGCKLIVDNDASALVLRDVLQHHEADMWCVSGKNADDPNTVRILLPEYGEPETASRPRMPAANLELSELTYETGSVPELDNRLMTELRYTVLLRDIAESLRIESVLEQHSQLPGLIYHLINGGVKMRHITRLITEFSDAILRKIIDFAIQDLGPPPVKFAFIVLGSEGRKEQTLKTDQDNAIIFEDADQESETTAGQIDQYFERLGDTVCTWLDQAGYDFCAGDIMAKNPKWRQPLAQWKNYFSEWIHAANPEDLLNSSIFFDFRFAYGDDGLVNELKQFLSDQMGSWTGFLRHLTENALHYKPPIGMFGRFVVASEGKHKNCLDLKSATTPIVDFARIYALKNNIRETNTLERLYQLCLKKRITRDAYKDIEQAYNFLIQMRFLRQIKAVIEEDQKPDNFVHPKTLSGIERKMLKEVFKKIMSFQTKLSFDLGADIPVSH